MNTSQLNVTFPGILFAISKFKEKPRGTALTLEELEDLFLAASSYRPGDEHAKPAPIQPAKIQREYPKLLVRYEIPTGKALEYLLVESADEWEAQYHSGGWYVRPQSDLELLHSENVPARKKTEGRI
jgi:hypothetical protein